jgi:hypothetical protein
VSTAEIVTAPGGYVDAVAEPAVAVRTDHLVVRHVDPRSVLRLSAAFYLCVSAVLFVAAVVLWIGAAATGVVGNVESFFRDAGFDGFRFAPFQLFRAFALIAVIITAAGSLANFLLAMLFNQLSDSVGGIRIAVAEDVEPEPRR